MTCSRGLVVLSCMCRYQTVFRALQVDIFRMADSGNGAKPVPTHTSSQEKAQSNTEASSKSNVLQNLKSSETSHVSVVTKHSKSRRISDEQTSSSVETAAAFVKPPAAKPSSHLPSSFTERKLHKSPKVSGKLDRKDKLSTSESADQAETARGSTQKCAPVSGQGTSVTSSDVKLSTVNPVTRAPPGAIKVHKVGKVSAFPHVKKASITASQGKTAQLHPQLLATETSASQSSVKESDVTGSGNVETVHSSQGKDVAVADSSTNPRTSASQGRRKRKTVREDATDGKARKSGEGTKHSTIGTGKKDVQTSTKGRKAGGIQMATATKASHGKDEVDKGKERQSPSSFPSTGQKSKRLQQRTTQVTYVSGTKAALGTAVKEQDSVLTEVLDVEMAAFPPPSESDVQTTDAMDVEDTEKTARTASEDDEDDGTYDLTALFDEEKQRAAWEEESQHPSKQRKKKKKKAKWWERKRKRGKTGEAEEDVEEGDEQGEVKKKKKKETRPRPNYFVAIRVSDEEIHRGLKAVQEAVLEQEKNLLPAMIPLINMHITLLVTHLTEEQSDRAKEALRLAKARLNPQFLRPENRLLLTFHGLGTFRNDVVFAKIQDNDHLTSLRELAETVHSCFVEKEVCSKNDKGFEPHLTLMKTSRNFGKLRSKGIKKIDPKLYEEFKEQRFGDQVVEGLQLCSMLKRKEADGYYHTEEQVMFGFGLEHIVANSIASRAVREALLQLGCKLLEQQAKSNPEAALHTLSDHIARSVIQDALTALEVDENVINNKEKVFSTDTMKAKVSDLSELLGTALVNEAIQEASCKRVENYTSYKENEKNVDNIVDPSETVVGNSRASTVTKTQSDLSGESVKDQEVNIAQTKTGESCAGVDEDVSSCKTSEGQLKDLSEKLVKEIIEAAMCKVQETESKK